IIGVGAAVVAVRLDPVDGVVVEQRLRAARADDRDLLSPGNLKLARLGQALDHPRQPLRLDRLDEVVEGLDSEGVDGVAIVRRDEDDSGTLPAVEDEPSDLEAGHPRQLDVEEDDVVADAPGERERLAGGRGLSDYLDLGVRGEQVAQLTSGRLLVVHDSRAIPRPLSRTVTRRRPRRTRARMTSRSGRSVFPCLTAFSTRGCTRNGGSPTASASGVASISTSSCGPKRACSSAR